MLKALFVNPSEKTMAHASLEHANITVTRVEPALEFLLAALPGDGDGLVENGKFQVHAELDAIRRRKRGGGGTRPWPVVYISATVLRKSPIVRDLRSSHCAPRSRHRSKSPARCLSVLSAPALRRFFVLIVLIDRIRP